MAWRLGRGMISSFISVYVASGLFFFMKQVQTFHNSCHGTVMWADQEVVPHFSIWIANSSEWDHQGDVASDVTLLVYSTG